MSRDDFAPDVAAALDRFSVPPMRAGLAERIVEAARTASECPPLRRDRRGAWKLARRVVIGTMAAGMVSAAAVASGLLGAAGIRVPVLTAMLAPEPKPIVAPKRVAARPKLSTPPVVTTVPVNPGLADPGLVDPGPIAAPVDFAARREAARARQIERRAFLKAHPEIRPVVRQAVEQQRAFVQQNPDVRGLWKLSPAERRAYLAERPELREALRTRGAERRALIEANPEAATLLRERIQARRAGRLAGATPKPDQPLPVEGNQQDAR